MTLLSLRQSNRRHAVGLGVRLALTIAAAIATAVLVAGCGSSGKAASSATTGRSAQVLATVRRGDLTDSVMGRVQLAATKSTVNVKGTVQVMGTNAAQVAAGQPVALTFVKLPAGAGRYFGQGSPRPSAAPSAGGGSGGSLGGGSGYGYGGQGLFGQGGQGGQGGAFRGKTAQGTVTAVDAGSNGAVTVTVTIAKLPPGVTAKYTGIAQIQVKVLASNVLIIPTAAIKGSGSNATVQLLAGGKTSTQSVVVGRQAGAESEITSGLSAGQNVVYTRTFTGRFPGPRTNGQSGGQGFPPSGGQSNGAPSGT